MIPTIESIVDDLVEGKITASQAVTWLHEHAADAGKELRDYFAAKAMQGMCADHTRDNSPNELAIWGYKIADALIAERSKTLNPQSNHPQEKAL